MKLLLLAPICLLSACSSPRYLYRFPEPPGAAATNQPPTRRVEPAEVAPFQAPKEAPTVYSADVAAPVPAPPRRIRPESPVVRHANPPVAEKPPAETHLDGDLKRAVIFVVAGGIALLIGGEVFYVAGSLSLLIGLIFGIKWFIRQ